MAQNQPYAQYPYIAQPQNIYQQLGKPQPQPHLQSAYQQQQQQQQQLVHVPQQQPQYQYTYQHQQSQPQQIQNVQRVPSAQGFQSSSFQNPPTFAPPLQQPVTPQPQQQLQQSVYQYPQQGMPTPSLTSTTYQPRPPSQNNSRIPTSSFANLPPGHAVHNILPRQLANNQTAGQLVPASQSLALRGPSPAMTPGPPISPSAVFAQQAQAQQPPLSTSLGSAVRNPTGVSAPKQIMPPPQMQPPSQVQISIPQQILPQSQSQPEIQPPPLPPRHQPQQQIQQPQRSPPKAITQRRPLPSPGAQRSFPSIQTSFPPVNTSTSANVGTLASSSVHNASPTRSGPALAQTASQPNSPNKMGVPSSSVGAPSSPTRASRPLPTPGSSGGGSNGGSSESPSGSLGREGFAGIGAKKNTSHITGLPIPSSITSQANMANINPFSLKVLPLPEGSTPEVTEDSDGPLTRSRASPPKFQPDVASTGSSPTKETSPPVSNINTPPSITPTSSKQSKAGPSDYAHNQAPTSTSPAKKFTPVWKRTIPDYPQPVFGYAAGMVSDPWAPPPKQQPTNTTTAAAPPPKKPTSEKMAHAAMRNLVEREHVERQLNAAMAQAHAQAQTQKRISGMPVSNTSYSAYSMYSRSNPNLHQQQQSGHVRSAAYDDGDSDQDEGEGDDEEEVSQEDEEEEEDGIEETEEEHETRRRKHSKKPSQPTVTGKKKKKGTKDAKEKKVQRKTKPNSRSTSLPPKKQTSSRPPTIPSTSEDETEATEMTQEETEEEEFRRSDTRHAKSSSVSSSRFKARVEKEREMLRKKRSYQQEYVEEYDDMSTSKKRDSAPIRRREPSPPMQQRQSYHQHPGATSAFRRRSPSPPYDQHSGFEYGGRRDSPSPPPNHRASRRVSPPRLSLLKDAQRKTIKLRGGNDDDEDVFIDRERGQRDEVQRWKKDERYRSQERERERNDSYMNRNKYADERYTSYHRHEDEDDRYERMRQEERDTRYTSARNARGRREISGANYPPQPPTSARRRDTGEREDQWSKSGRRDERNASAFNLGRAESPSRPIRDSGFKTGYQQRPASPTRNFPQYQSSRNNPSDSPLMSPYHSQPVSPSVDDHGGAGLVTKFTAINIQGRERNSGRVEQGEWPIDLPRLPRTPGETPNTSGGGYFDYPTTRDAYSTSGSGSRPATEFARMRGRPPAVGNYDPGYGHPERPLRKDSHSPHHYSNLQMNLDDPPPRSLSPAISQGSNSYGRNDTHLQHKRVQSQPQPITHGTMPQRSSVYDSNSIPGPEPPSPVKPRPQSQVYAHQAHPSQPPSPRPQSIHPLDRANMNTSNIHNGTPKVQTINIESPAPVGGREKKADLNRMMSDPEDEGFATPVPRNNRRDGGNRRQNMNPPQESIISVDSPRGPMIQIDEPIGPIVQVESPRGPMIQVDSPRAPKIQIDSPRGPVVNINPPQRPVINVEISPPHSNTYSAPNVRVYDVPGISVAGPEFDNGHDHERASKPPQHQEQKQHYPRSNRGGLICGGCDGPIIGRIVSAMGARWHPQCFRCVVCNELLEHVSSYEHDGKPYCHLDYHENFAPRCFSCKTSIVEERFISLDDPALGKRTYHEQHFFCAECGDPFLAPSMNHSSRTGELNVQGDGEFESDDVGFTVYKGHPYCEACHVRLRLPKCKKCKKSIRDHEQAVEALGGKWCWGCFVCASCEQPFENPSFFQRGDKPFCERCFDIMLRNEV